jgi:hypothetical protein
MKGLEDITFQKKENTGEEERIPKNCVGLCKIP